MRTDLWDQFDGLVGPSPRLLATVTAHKPTGPAPWLPMTGRKCGLWASLGASSRATCE